MRKPIFVKRCSVGLIAIVAACSSPAEENAVEADAVNATETPAAGNAADANAAAPAGNAAAASAAGNAAAAEGDEYRARGYEPGWSMVIDDQIMFAAADGPDITVATPPQQPTRAGYRYVTPEMKVMVNTFVRCTAADGDVYHDTVRVMIGRQNFSGCGGAVISTQ